MPRISPNRSGRLLLIPLPLFDKHMTLVPHVNFICRSAYMHVKNIGCIRRFLSVGVTKYVPWIRKFPNNISVFIYISTDPFPQYTINTDMYSYCSQITFSHVYFLNLFILTFAETYWLPLLCMTSNLKSCEYEVLNC